MAVFLTPFHAGIRGGIDGTRAGLNCIHPPVERNFNGLDILVAPLMRERLGFGGVSTEQGDARAAILRGGNEQGNLAPPSPVGRVELAERQAQEAARRAAGAEPRRLLATELSPKTCEATGDTADADPLFVSFAEEEAVFEREERQRELRASNLELRRALDEAERRRSLWLPSTEAVAPSRGPDARRQERQKERAAEKKAKAARKRAQAQRRRAA